MDATVWADRGGCGMGYSHPAIFGEWMVQMADIVSLTERRACMEETGKVLKVLLRKGCKREEIEEVVREVADRMKPIIVMMLLYPDEKGSGVMDFEEFIQDATDRIYSARNGTETGKWVFEYVYVKDNNTDAFLCAMYDEIKGRHFKIYDVTGLEGMPQSTGN